MVIWVSRKRPFREGCAGGITLPSAPTGTADGALGKTEEGHPAESLPRGELLILAKVFLFFLVVAGIALLMGYAALTTPLLARH